MVVGKKKNRYDFSLILACYNEENHLEKSFKKITNLLDLSKFRYEIVFVDDASRDSTRELIKSIIKEYPNHNIKSVFHDKNTGRGGAVTSGIKAAEGDIAGYIDVDLEVSPLYIPYCVDIVRKTGGLVIGWRIYKVQLNGAFRYLTHWIYLHLVRNLIGVKFLKDTESGYKFFPRDKILPVLNRCRDTHWFWSTEFVAQSFIEGINFIQIPCLYIRNTNKKSTVKVLRDSLKYFRSLLSFYKRERENLKKAKVNYKHFNDT